jgi:predicted nucleic acid-binding protein
VDRVFLDANILFAASRKPTARILRLWDIPSVVLLTSAYGIDEARRNLHETEQHARLDRLIRSVQVVFPSHPSGREERQAAKRSRRRSWRTREAEAVELPPDDRPILLAAVEARATHLLTGNHRDFGKLYGRRIASVLVLPPAEYPPLFKG